MSAALDAHCLIEVMDKLRENFEIAGFDFETVCHQLLEKKNKQPQEKDANVNSVQQSASFSHRPISPVEENDSDVTFEKVVSRRPSGEEKQRVMLKQESTAYAFVENALSRKGMGGMKPKQVPGKETSRKLKPSEVRVVTDTMLQGLCKSNKRNLKNSKVCFARVHESKS